MTVVSPAVDEWRRLRDYVGRHGPLELGRAVVEAFARNRLLTYASAISYQILFALVPSVLAALAVLGFLDLRGVWEDELAPRVEERVSEPMFTVIQSAADRVLDSGQGFWLTAGLALALWEISGAVRATMGALNGIYGAEEERPFLHRMALSVVLALVVVAGFGVGLVAIHFGPGLAELAGLGGPVVDVLRFAVAAAVMLAVVAVLVRFGPAEAQPAPWMSVVALAVVAGWIGASLLFALYATTIASYGSLYGGLAAVIVLMTYVYLSVLVFLTGVQLDGLVRAEDRGLDAHGGRA